MITFDILTGIMIGWAASILGGFGLVGLAVLMERR